MAIAGAAFIRATVVSAISVFTGFLPAVGIRWTVVSESTVR